MTLPEKPNTLPSERIKTATKLRKTARVLIGSIPQEHVGSAGRLLGTLLYILDTRHRRIVRRNLSFTHPLWSSERIGEVSKLVYQNLGITFLEICQMAVFSKNDVMSRVHIHGEEYLRQAANNPRGAIMISAHLGNWEMSSLFASCYFEKSFIVVGKELRFSPLNRCINRLRSRFGNVVLDKKNALPKMVRGLRQGKTLGILIDQATTHAEGVSVDFFARKVTATPAAALMARRYGCPVLPAYCVREKDHVLTLIVEPPLELQKTNEPHADILVNTQKMTEAIEGAIKNYIDQWFWFHKRWKRYYPQLYPEDIARRQRKRKKRLSQTRDNKEEKKTSAEILSTG